MFVTYGEPVVVFRIVVVDVYVHERVVIREAYAFPRLHIRLCEGHC